MADKKIEIRIDAETKPLEKLQKELDATGKAVNKTKEQITRPTGGEAAKEISATADALEKLKQAAQEADLATRNRLGQKKKGFDPANLPDLSREAAALKNNLAEAKANLVPDLQQQQQATGFLDSIIGKGREIADVYQQAGGGIGGFLAAMSTGAAKGAAAIAGLAFGAKKALDAYAHTQVEVRRLDQALANNGLLTDANRKKYQQLAQTLENETAVSFDSWLEVIRQLTQQGTTPETIDRDSKAVKSLVGIYGTAEQAAMAWGKALHGQFDIMREHGIIVDQNASNAEKLNQAYEEIVRRGGGQLEAQAETLTGAWNRLSLGGQALLRSMGGIIGETGLLQRLLYGLGTSAQWVAGIFSQTLPAADGLKNGIRKLAHETKSAREQQRELGEALDLQKRKFEEASYSASGFRDAVRSVHRAQQEIADAEYAAALAEVDIAEKSGRITGSRAIQIRAQLEATKAAEDKRRADEAARAQIEADQQAIQTAQQEVQTIEKKIAAAEKQLVAAREYEQVQARLQSAQAAIDKALEDATSHGLVGLTGQSVDDLVFASRKNAGLDRIMTDLLAARAAAAGKSPAQIQEEISQLQEMRSSAQESAAVVLQEALPRIGAAHLDLDTRQTVHQITAGTRARTATADFAQARQNEMIEAIKTSSGKQIETAERIIQILRDQDQKIEKLKLGLWEMNGRFHSHLSEP